MEFSRELTDRQRSFVQEYCVHGNAAAAARAAGYSEAVCRQTAHKLLLKPHIAAEVRRQSVAMIEAHLPSAVATLAELMEDRGVEPKDRVRAAEILLRHSKPAAGPAVALQVNVGRGAADAQSVIRRVYEARDARLAPDPTTPKSSCSNRSSVACNRLKPLEFTGPSDAYAIAVIK